MTSSDNSLVIQGGTLIDGTGGKARKNDCLVIEGNRITSVGVKPKGLNLKNPDRVECVDATGQWVMPGLIDAHVHLSFGHPMYPGIGRGTISAEFTTLRTAMNAQAVLRAGVTSISVPGGAWFSDVAVREAINAGIIVGPRIFCAGRLLSVLGGGGDREPYWVGTPDHAISKLCHGTHEMIAEVRRQAKHYVNYVKLIDSDWGDFQAFADDELKAIAGEAHRRNLICAIHSRGSASTRAATKAGFDWIIHGDFATNKDLDLMAKHGTAILPTFTSAALAIQREGGFGLFPNEKTVLKRHMDACANMCRQAYARGVKLLSGSDTGNIGWMTYGAYHAKEAEIFVNDVGLTPMEAIVSMTRDNATTVGLDGEVGTLEAGKLADVIVLNADPLADITVLQDPRQLAVVVKDGKAVDLISAAADMIEFQRIAAE